MLIGGGHAHALLLKYALDGREANNRDIKNAFDNNSVSMISPNEYAYYSGMLPSVIAGNLSAEEAKIPIKHLCKALGVGFIAANARAFDSEKNQIQLDNNSVDSADYYFWNTGLAVNPSYFANANCGSVRPVENLLNWWSACRQSLQQSFSELKTTSQDKSDSTYKKITVVGGGVASVELCLAIYSALQDKGLSDYVQLTLLSSSANILNDLPKRAQQQILEKFYSCGITILSNFRVVKVEKNQVVGSADETLSHDFCLWAAQKQAPELFKTSGIQLDKQGCIAVDSDLRSLSHANVFAAGDIATLLEEPHEKNGVYAVRHAEVLYHNFMQTLGRFTWRAKRLARLKPFEPQRHYLALIDLSDGSAIAVKGTWSYKGRSMLWLKKWIDNRFVRQFYIALNKRS